VASGFWFNIGGETCVSAHRERGRHGVADGGHARTSAGLRASLAAVAADELGVPYDKVRPIIGDTGSLGFNFLTGGSRSAFSGSMAIVEAAKQIKADLCARAGKLWEAKPDQVEFSEGHVRPLGALAEKVKPMSVADFAKVAGKTGGPIGGVGRINAQGAAPASGLIWSISRSIRRRGGRRSCAIPSPRTRGGPCTRRTSRDSIRAARCRGSAGRSTRSTSTARTASCRTPASSTTACRWRPTCR
jgi:CO/xanthine dehydrogenase Mo-binding subunit